MSGSKPPHMTRWNGLLTPYDGKRGAVGCSESRSGIRWRGCEPKWRMRNGDTVGGRHVAGREESGETGVPPAIQIKQITLRAAGLEPMVEQLQLFSQHLPEEQTRVKQHRLVLALDQIRERFGTTAIQRGIASHDRTEVMRGTGTHQRESLHGA